MKEKILIFIDGSCYNQSFNRIELENLDEIKMTYGGWAIIAVSSDEEYNNPKVIYEKSDGVFNTTNNRMEIEAFIESLRFIKDNIAKTGKKDGYVIVSDSQFLIKSVLFYIKKWVINDWKTVNGLPVKNQEQFKICYDLYYKFLKNQEKVDIELKWIKSHTNKSDIFSLYNNLVDLKAKEIANSYKEDHIDEYNDLENKLKFKFAEKMIKNYE